MSYFNHIKTRGKGVTDELYRRLDGEKFLNAMVMAIFKLIGCNKNLTIVQ